MADFFGKQNQENLPQIGLFMNAAPPCAVSTSVVKASPQYLLVRVVAPHVSDEPEISIKSLVHAKSEDPFAVAGTAVTPPERLNGSPCPAIAAHTVYTVQVIPEIVC